jgi:hypothetical protein
MTGQNIVQVNSLLLEAIDQGMELLGDRSVKHAFYHHIEKRGVRRDEIAEKLELFHRALIDLFGVGSRIIERRIARIFFQRLDSSFKEREEWTLIDYVMDAREKRITCNPGTIFQNDIVEL